jgi:hypothetical protein
MKRIAFLLVAVAANSAPASGHADGEAVPIFGVTIPRRGVAQNLLPLPRARQSSGLCLHPLRTLMQRPIPLSNCFVSTSLV